MDRAIFSLELSLEATSIYILICSLQDEGHAPTLQRIRSLWNGTEENLRSALRELMERRVLESARELVDDIPVTLNPRDKWQW
jgi:hypothetical protein